ncbi:MAG TPA: translation elongation factor 4 [Candidatus Azoamicus sp. OHIO2]
MIKISNVRNFSVIAHINHGKSTLADRFLEICRNLKLKKTEEQCLDTMDIERERGITIKAQCLTLEYTFNSDKYLLNLIDTPGHTDFSYEVNRSLSACEGVILLIDVTKGIQAQTISNYNKALEKNLSIIVVLNKVDLNIKKDNIIADIECILGVHQIIQVSAKTGYGVKELIECVIQKIPSPKEIDSADFTSLIIDAWFDQYIGITCLVKVKSGEIRRNDKVVLSFNKKVYKISEIGIFIPEKKIKDKLCFGEIGFVSFAAKDLEDIKVGTYIHSEKSVCFDIFPKKDFLPKVYANIYPINSDDFALLKKAVLKLSLNDSSLIFVVQKSQLFGFGFRCGFLGVLHLEVTKERLEREYNLEIIVTPPNITFKIVTIKLQEIYISSPYEIDNINCIKEIQEQITLTTIITPMEYLGKIMQLCIQSRGIKDDITYLGDKIYLKYKIPLNEMIFNFFSQLQTISNGFASLDYEILGYVKADLNKLTILINNKKLDALEFIVHNDKIRKMSVDLIEKIKTIIPRQLFEVKIQAAVGKKIIAKGLIKALKKNVLAKCYGGDITRKKKLLEKQKLGKRKLKKIGNVEIPHDAFIRIMNLNK